jgi:hypothetical protein
VPQVQMEQFNAREQPAKDPSLAAASRVGDEHDCASRSAVATIFAQPHLARNSLVGVT